MSFWTAIAYDCAVHGLERHCLSTWRSELLASLGGDILELGAGTGVNLDYYPTSLRQLTLLEPDPFMRRRLTRRLAVHSLGARARVLDATAETLPLGDATLDAVVGTLVLCSVTDVARVLGEVQRVLKPGGILVLIEHVAAPADTRRRRWQRRFAPAWTVVSGGCHLLSDPRPALDAAGFKPVQVLERELCRVPGFMKPAIVGTWTI